MISVPSMQDESPAKTAPAVPVEIQDALRRALEGKRENGEPQNYQVEMPQRPESGEPGGIPQGLDEGIGVVFFILRIFFYIIVAAVVIGLVLAVTRSYQARQQSDEVENAEDTAESVLAGAQVEVDRSQVSALADRGDFGDAIHLLLLLTFQSLCDLAGTDLRPAWTSREILREIPLPEAAQRALRSLVAAVELSHFGGVVPTRSDYELALDRFEDFVTTLRNGKIS